MRKILLVICLLATFSCQSNKEDSYIYSLETFSYNLAGSSDLIFDKPSHIYNDTLVSFDSFQNKIIKAPLNGNSALELNLLFSFEAHPSTFYYINSDSIIFSTGSELILTDQKGNHYNSLRLFEKLDEVKNEVYTEYPYDGFSQHLFYDKISKSVLFYFAKKSQINRRKVFARIKLNNGEWESLSAYHPEEYKGIPLNYSTYPSVTWSPNGLSFIYTISPKIVNVDTILESQKEYSVKSFDGKQLAEPQTNRDDWSADYFESWVLSSPSYVKLIYDPFRKLYYRFSQAALNKFPDGEEYYYDFLIKNRELYLTILDDEFNLVLNQSLPKGKYDPSRSFVFSKGLWIPHEISTLKDENKLYGDLFQVVK
jgi:hypothetical protein